MPNSAQAHFNLAILLADCGRIGAAIRHYREVLRLDRDHADAHYNLGVLLAHRGETEEAAAEFQKALEIRPDFAEARRNLGILRRCQRAEGWHALSPSQRRGFRGHHAVRSSGRATPRRPSFLRACHPAAPAGFFSPFGKVEHSEDRVPCPRLRGHAERVSPPAACP